MEKPLAQSISCLQKDAVRQGNRLVVEGRPDVLVRFSQRGMNTAGMTCFQLPYCSFAVSVRKTAQHQSLRREHKKRGNVRRLREYILRKQKHLLARSKSRAPTTGNCQGLRPDVTLALSAVANDFDVLGDKLLGLTGMLIQVASSQSPAHSKSPLTPWLPSLEWPGPRLRSGDGCDVCALQISLLRRVIRRPDLLRFDGWMSNMKHGFKFCY